MPKIATMPQVPLGLITANDEAFMRKVSEYATAGAAKLHVIFDFDRTLTVRKSEVYDGDVTSWHILRSHLPENGQEMDGQRRYDALFAEYRAKEIAETLTEQDAITWWSSTLDLFVEYEVNMNEVENDFVERASVRPGTAELFNLCNELEIPTIILSAGMRDVINVWSRVYGVDPTIVLSTALITDRRGRVIGWDKNTLVHVMNKHEAGHDEIAAIKADRPNVLVVGDSLGDADMVDDEALRIRIYDPRVDALDDLDRVKRRTFDKFDALILKGDFMPLIRLVEIIAAKN
jgi:HAD superfamily phosphoserine phosphatase-like hydrolase